MHIQRLVDLNLLENITESTFALQVGRKKGSVYYFYISNLKMEAINILKQEALSVGGDLILPKEAILCKKDFYNGILIATKSQMERIIEKCFIQPFGLKNLAKIFKSHMIESKFTPKIMGIINITDDSFYENSRFKDTNKILEKIDSMINEGASIIDIGGASSRPDSEYVPFEKEMENIKSALLSLKDSNLLSKAAFSIDSYNYETILFALENGFSIINDVYGLSDERIMNLALEFDSKIVVMHNSWIYPHSGDIVQNVDDFFALKIEALEKIGVNRKNIILDIGFGFGKNTLENISLIKALKHFMHFGCEILVGASRKRSIGEITNTSIESRLAPTIALHQIALQYGASIIRCHDVVEHKYMIDILNEFSCNTIEKS